MTQSQALSILQTGVNVFLTGEPGSGKTHTINAYVDWLRSHSIEPAITASTGIAATHIHGMTIHSWSGIGIREHLTPADLDAIASKEHVVRRIQKAHILIIDEVSMLSGTVLSMVNDVCKEVRHSPLPFGGLQVVLVGDFFQLPPISRGKTDEEGSAFAFRARVWEETNPVICYLTEQHRQEEDGALLEVLSAVRAGTWDESHASVILSREVESEGFDEDVPRLFTHNVDVDRINEQKLAQLSGKAVTYRMSAGGAPLMVEALKRGCLSPEALVLKEGAVVMGTKNIPISGLANGTLGVVIGFEPGTQYPIIETNDGDELVVAPVDWAVEENGKVRANITQVPLRLAWAITVHKSQGMSMDAAAIDLSRTFEYGQGYVALSRIRSLAGLHLLGWNEHAWMVHPRVQLSDKDFRARSEAAGEHFDEMQESGERTKLEEQFIKASGGTMTKVKVESPLDKKKSAGPKESTYDKTLQLIQAGKSITEVVKERSLTFGTISDHLEKLAKVGKLDIEQITKALPPLLHAALPRFAIVFAKIGTERLTPVFEELNGAHSYDEIKIARVVYELQKK